VLPCPVPPTGNARDARWRLFATEASCAVEVA
jgi:hypothetical protein